MDEFILALQLILSSTLFTFNGKIYKQTFGTLMGSPLSLVIADVVLQDLEEKAFKKINLNVPFFRYVDDNFSGTFRSNIYDSLLLIVFTIDCNLS